DQPLDCSQCTRLRRLVINRGCSRRCCRQNDASSMCVHKIDRLPASLTHIWIHGFPVESLSRLPPGLLSLGVVTHVEDGDFGSLPAALQDLTAVIKTSATCIDSLPRGLRALRVALRCEPRRDL